MSDEVYKAYMMEKEYQRANNITCKETVDGYSDFIFINGEGKLLKVSNFNHALKIIIKQCNNDSTDVILPCFSAHSFRHTLSTRLNENNVNLSVIKRILGHFSSDITIKTYIDVDDEFVRSEYLRSESNYFKYKASINAKS